MRRTPSRPFGPRASACRTPTGFEESQPPLRPDAPKPRCSASTTPTDIPGECCRIQYAVHRPEYPAPTTKISNRESTSNVGVAGQVTDSSAIQNDILPLITCLAPLTAAL